MEFFFNKYNIKNGDEIFSYLQTVNRRHPLQFPVTLEKFTPNETTEIIEEKSDILNLKELGLTHFERLKDQIMYLVHDMLIWYKKKSKTHSPLQCFTS